MRLKWLPVRLRRRRRVSRMAIDFASVRRLATALHFCGGPANVSCPRPIRASWVGASVLARRTYSPASLALRGATEESHCCESFARCGAGPSGLGPRLVGGEPRRSLRAVDADGASLSAGGLVAPCAAVVGARMAASDPS